MERINVAVRARPLSPEDAKSSPWRISGNSILFANPTTKFDFDRIFGEDCRTVDVYQTRTKAIVSAAIGGFNGTVFAYGQTNSGKTHTMRGSSVEPGVIPLAVHDLFDMIQQEMDREFLLRMSYMEIYNEEINDLLAPEHRKLQIHESIERGIFVAGLKEEIVTSPKQVLEFMDFGEAHRHIGETNMNLHSSRSHTIFRMIIESRDKVEDEYAESSCDAVRVSVLNLVDLAGSERAAKTGAEGVRLKEGSHINKSLMTLGTVIKKLSEGAESQGGHVPYRDSKLTRILQPALGGNANTAIICNITLAQIHADETKSSLQFASRALRVTNCVHVNEILTDAALLKRQKKEIEELRAKLQGSHSEHLGDEILNLRNTLLQSELERERIALELEEEKKAQAERDKILQEQAKKIQNLSSMVLCSNRDEVPNHRKKEKRRDTWAPGKLPKKMMNELPSTIPTQASAMKPVIRNERERGPLLPFEELVNDNASNAFKKEKDCKSVGFCDVDLPDSRSLMHVTSRKKASNRNKSLPTESVELTEMKAEYEKLLLEFEAERTTNGIQIDYLTRRLADASSCLNKELKINDTSNTDKSSMEIETILVIKQLQEKISVLEMEKASNMQNLNKTMELDKEKDKDANKKYEELYMELMAAKEEANLAHQQLNSLMDEDSEALTKLSKDIQEIKFEIQQSKTVFESEHMQSYSAISDLIADAKSFFSNDFTQIKRLFVDYEKVHSCMKAKVDELEREKISVLQMEKASNLQNLDSVVELKTHKDKNANNAYEELYMELMAAKEEASLAHQQLASLMDKDFEELKKLSTNIQEITCEMQHSKSLVDSMTSMMDEHLQSCSALSDFITDIESFSSHDITQIKRLRGDCEKVYSCMKAKVEEFQRVKSTVLEKEKYSSMQNLDSFLELESEKDNKHEKDEDSEALTKLSANIKEITSDFQQSKTFVDSLTSIMDEHLQSSNSLIDDIKSFSSHNFTQIKTLLGDYEKVNSCMKVKIQELEHEKLLMYNESQDLEKRLEEACLNGENSSRALTELSERYEAETNELITEIRTLENEIGHLSTSVLAKEKETMRKDLEKTKAKLKETESKLRNTIQEKTKLEGEKASTEREIKRLHSQKAILERDINKRESIAGRRRDSAIDRSSNVFDPRKGKGFGVNNNIDQEEFKKLEVLAFEMERTIESLEEQLAIANNENQQTMLRSESLVLEVQDLSEKLEFSNSELERLEELVSSLRANLEEAALQNQNADSSINKLMEEKEEMAMHLTDALLGIEEERAIWSNTQKASLEAIESNSKSYNAEIASLTNTISEVRNELEACRKENNIINEKLIFTQEKMEVEKTCSEEKSLEIDTLKNDLILVDDQRKISEDALRSNLETISLDHQKACEEVHKLQVELNAIIKERDDLAANQDSVSKDDIQKLQNRIEELQNHKTEQQLLMENCNDKLSNSKAEVEKLTMKLSTLEAKTHCDGVKGGIERAKLRMRLNGAQTRLDGMRVRCKEEMEEKEYMHKKFEDATHKLKEQLIFCRTENMNLKKHLLLKD